MFEGTFLTRHHPLQGNVCAIIRWKLNLSESNAAESKPTYLDSSCDLNDISMSLTFLPVSLLGLLLSVLSAWIFIRQRQRTSFRMSLVALSMATSGCMLFTSLDYINVLSGACHYWEEPGRHIQVFVAAVVCLMSDTLLCLRNWCNLLMTAQRTEALIFPLRVKKLLNRKNFVTSFTLLFLLFLPMSLVRSISEFFIVCSDANVSYSIIGYPLEPEDEANHPELSMLEHHYRYLMHHGWFSTFEAHVFFAVQTLIPVSLVVAFSLGMAVAMLRSKGSSAGSSQSKRNKARASRTVLCLAVKFSILQMPTYLGNLLQSSDNELVNEFVNNKTYHFVAELCLLLDSIFSMFVYSYFVPDFKAYFVRAWRWLTCRPADERSRGFPLCSSDYSRRAQDSMMEARALRARDLS